MTSLTCPACGAEMKERKGKFGSFLGCERYPSCRATRQLPKSSAPESGATQDAPSDSSESIDAAPTPTKLPTFSYKETTDAYQALLARLDDDQREFVAWTPAAGNTRVVAAAGSGKSTSTVALLAKLVREGEVNARQIVATTFTSKAGKELAERLNAVLPPGALEQMRVGTFHGLSLRALRGSDSGRWRMDHCLDIGKRASGIPSASKLWSMVLGYAGTTGLPGTGTEGLGLEEPDIRAYALAVDVARSKGLTGAALTEALRATERDDGLPYLARSWEMYSNVKTALGAWDFADALQAWHDVLAAGTGTPGIVVIVDEAQDNSQIQLEIARLLARSGSLLLVGDIRQSIYSWRGAYPDMFAHADTTIGATTRQIRNNYRSGSSIVDLGNKIAANKSWNIGDAAAPARAETGSISVAGYADPEAEAREVASKIQALAHDGAALDSIAILCRTNALSGAFEGALVAAGIPCVVVGGQPFFKRYEVQNALAYVTLAVRDDLEAFARIVNKPRRYLGAKFVASVAAASGGDLLEKIDAVAGRLNSRQREAAIELRCFLSALRAAPWPAGVDSIVKLLSPTGENNTAGEADSDRSGLVAAVASLARGFDSAEKFLDFALRCAGEVISAQAADGGFELPAGRVTISTIHKSKGLEWSNVFVSASAGTFPHARATGDRYDEEERLFYVATTRAKDSLTLTYSDVDLYGRTAGASEFLKYVSGPETSEPLPEAPKGSAPKTMKAKAPTRRRAKQNSEG